MATSSSALVQRPEVDTDDPNIMGVYFAPKAFRYSRVGSDLTDNDHYVTDVGVGSVSLCVTWIWCPRRGTAPHSN